VNAFPFTVVVDWRRVTVGTGSSARVTTFGYDPLDRLSSVTDPLLRVPELHVRTMPTGLWGKCSPTAVRWVSATMPTGT